MAASEVSNMGYTEPVMAEKGISGIGKGNNNLYLNDETVYMNYGVVDDNTFTESDNEPVGENENILDDEKLWEDSAIVPKVGMKFKNDNEIFEFYKRYAYCIGFPVRKRNSKKGDDEIVRYLTLTCSR
ncbi:Protein FAR1-RELATED SEQUENCE [Abeliophyllum distichum]|uniref:Protein FAR1-RELATED SEQUENCE n=1 Tax=Abeliophyllum distichum TaxID=126358 RepID=A0ABD1V8C2_9LAMI